MKLLTFTGLYPNAAQPRHGIFVENRLRRLITAEGWSASVVAPVPWVPPGLRKAPRYQAMASAPDKETRAGISVEHPRWLSIPKIGMGIAPWFLAQGSRSAVSRLLDGPEMADIIDAHYFYPDGVAAARLAGSFGKPLVITARGSDINLIAEIPGPRHQILMAAERAEAIIAVSDALARRMAEIGMPSEKIVTLRNGVDLDLFAPDTRVASSDGRPFILTVGNIVVEKGQLQLIEALSSLPDFDLVIAGDGEARDSCNALVKRLNLSARVRFTGNVPQEDLPALYRKAALTVLASEREGMPNVVLESLACGTPVVATNVGGVPEILTADVAGRIVADREPATLAGAISDLYRNLPDQAAVRDHALQFSWDETIAAQRILYEGILARAAS